MEKGQGSYAADRSISRRIDRIASTFLAIAWEPACTRILSVLCIRVVTGFDSGECAALVSQSIFGATMGGMVPRSRLHRLGDRRLSPASFDWPAGTKRRTERQSAIREHYKACYSGRISLDQASSVRVAAGARMECVSEASCVGLVHCVDLGHDRLPGCDGSCRGARESTALRRGLRRLYEIREAIHTFCLLKGATPLQNESAEYYAGPPARAGEIISIG